MYKTLIHTYMFCRCKGSIFFIMRKRLFLRHRFFFDSRRELAACKESSMPEPRQNCAKDHANVLFSGKNTIILYIQ